MMQVDASFSFDELFMSYWVVSKEGVSKTFQKWSQLLWALQELGGGFDHRVIVIAIGKQQENSTSIAIIYPGEILFLQPAFAITIGE